MCPICAPIHNQQPRTTVCNPESKKYPFLLRALTINRPNQVWCADVTYLPMRHGFLYLVAIMDWHSRKILPWRVSNTIHADFCIEALEEALAKHGRAGTQQKPQGLEAVTPVLPQGGPRWSSEFFNILKKLEDTTRFERATFAFGGSNGQSMRSNVSYGTFAL
jgi:transposase InsO family protein